MHSSNRFTRSTMCATPLISTGHSPSLTADRIRYTRVPRTRRAWSMLLRGNGRAVGLDRRDRRAVLSDQLEERVDQGPIARALPAWPAAVHRVGERKPGVWIGEPD